MALDDSGMHRAGLAFLYRIVPVLVATSLYGIYFAILCVATRGLIQRGLTLRTSMIILVVLYTVFLLSTALWALEVAQLFGLVELLLSPDGLPADTLFNRFYDLIARETKITGVLFEIQMIVGDVLVIWRAGAIWFDRRSVILLPLFWWILMIVNLIVHGSLCQSGVSSTNYSELCKATDVLAPVLSIVTNVCVMIIILWKGWILRDTLLDVWHRRKSNKVFTVFVLCVESGTLYVIMLITDLLVTSLVTGGDETVGRMIDCISGYATVQLVGMYPTLMLVLLKESVWSASDDGGHSLSISTMRFTTARPFSSGLSIRGAEYSTRNLDIPTTHHLRSNIAPSSGEDDLARTVNFIDTTVLSSSKEDSGV